MHHKTRILCTMLGAAVACTPHAIAQTDGEPAGTASTVRSSDMPVFDADMHARGKAVAARAIAYLRTQQDETTGGWRHADDRPNFPAISALVLTGMLMEPSIDTRDESVSRGIDYVLSFAKPDGGIHDDMLASYNTSICLSMLANVRTPEAARVIGPGVAFLRTLQYHEGFSGSIDSGDLAEPVPESHPYYGGVGYGRHGRPDLSNTGFFVQALHDAGVSSDDPAMQRALVFLRRLQMQDEINERDYADGSDQGGFIYATVPNRESVDGFAGQSQAGEYEEVTEDGARLTRLRAYGSMTYVGFKSLIFADLARDDPRVVAARRWIDEHYTMEENPGLGAQGLYYNYVALARALDAWGEPSVADGRDWRADLVVRLEGLQNPDGSFEVLHDRWMENDPVLITAYSLIALQHALN